LIVAFLAELLSSLITDKLTDTILTISAVYGSYALASSLGVSGLIAVTVVGLYFGNFTIRTTMGQTTRETVTVFWEFAAFVGNSIAFLFIGFSTDIFKLASSIYTILLAYFAVTIARAASVYPILTIFDRFDQKIPLKWRNVAMLGGMRGALSIALAASVPLTVLSATDRQSLSTLILGVAFISISIQAALLFRYIKRRFPTEQLVSVENLNARLMKAASAIESLETLREEGRISDEEFARQLDSDKEELRDVLQEINATVDPRNILRQRASELYTSVLTKPVTRARQAFRREREQPPEKSSDDDSAEGESSSTA
jgi:monovalent cation:H+ antiporter, CPA1 family